MNVKNLYNKLKIKNKLILVHFSIVLSICVVSLVALQAALRFYDDLLYNEAAEVLNLSTINIENELRKMESLSYAMVSDQSVQEIISFTGQRVFKKSMKSFMNLKEKVDMQYGI